MSEVAVYYAPPKPKYTPGEYVYWKTKGYSGDGIIQQSQYWVARDSPVDWYYLINSGWVQEECIYKVHDNKGGL